MATTGDYIKTTVLVGLLAGAAAFANTWFNSDKGEKTGMPEKQVAQAEPKLEKKVEPVYEELRTNHPAIDAKYVFKDDSNGDKYIDAIEISIDPRTSGFTFNPTYMIGAAESNSLTPRQSSKAAQIAWRNFRVMYSTLEDHLKRKYRTNRSMVPQDLVKVMDSLDSTQSSINYGRITPDEIMDFVRSGRYTKVFEQ